MKQIAALLLCIGMAVTLAACSGGGPSQSSSSGASGAGTSSSSISQLQRDTGDKREVHSYDEALEYLKEFVKPEGRYTAGETVDYADRGTEEVNDVLSYMVSVGPTDKDGFVPEHHFAVCTNGDIFEINTDDGTFTKIF